MELTRKVTYEIKHNILEVGDLEGKVEILTNSGSSTPNPAQYSNSITLIKHTGLGIEELYI